MSAAEGSPGVRSRRQPPTFRPVAVRSVERTGPRMARLTLAGPALAGMTVADPAASVRLLLASPGADDLVTPTWNGNEFLLPDGRRPVIRTFTPRRLDPVGLELDIDVVLHGHGVASEWAGSAAPGRPAAVSGPGRGYTIDRGASAYVLAGDETAIPAISQLLEALPVAMAVQVCVEVAEPAGRQALPDHPGAVVEWCDLADGASPGDALLAAFGHLDLTPGARVWVAGEAAGVQRIRRHLFDQRGLPRTQASVRGYWKHGRAGDEDDG